MTAIVSGVTPEVGGVVSLHLLVCNQAPERELKVFLQCLHSYCRLSLSIILVALAIRSVCFLDLRWASNEPLEDVV